MYFIHLQDNLILQKEIGLKNEVIIFLLCNLLIFNFYYNYKHHTKNQNKFNF